MDANPAYDVLGKAIYAELEHSREVSKEEYSYYWNNKEWIASFNDNINREVMKNYGYKNYREICKDTLFLSVSIFNDLLEITPYHQDGLGTFTGIKNKPQGLQLEYSVGLSNEELGKAVMEAFEYCTSIYKKK